jgi:carbamoyltransferase
MNYIEETAGLLSDQKVVGWFQGNGEIGPRALGNRSILMDPRNPNGKWTVNQIKKRENYRPFGASVLQEYAQDYFDMPWEDPYMLYISNVKVPNLTAITHIDGTCRIQTVNKNNNNLFRELLEKFYEITGCPILLNTSLNVAGKPLASKPDDVIEIFDTTTIDAVVIGKKIIRRS